MYPNLGQNAVNQYPNQFNLNNFNNPEPSAPPEDDFFGTVNPAEPIHPAVVLNPDVKEEPLYPPLFPKYPQLFPEAPSVPVVPNAQVVHGIKEKAQDAYFNAWNDLEALYLLPEIQLDKENVQSLKQIEERSKQGGLTSLISLMIKVLQVVSKLTLGILVGSSTILIFLSILSKNPGLALFVSSFLSLPLLVTTLSVCLASRLSVGVLNRLKQAWINRSFQSAIKKEQSSIDILKPWVKVKDLSQKEDHIKKVKEQVLSAWRVVGYSLEFQDQCNYLDQMIHKIGVFRTIENELDLRNKMPLLNQHLNK